MSVMEVQALDMSAMLMHSYDIGEMINRSVECREYLHWKQQVEQNQEIQQFIIQFGKLKEKFAECERFGHYHPDYHAAWDKVRQAEQELEGYEEVRQFKAAEQALDDLLFQVSETIARAVSPSIKVPSNDPLPKSSCGSGGACSGKCS